MIEIGSKMAEKNSAQTNRQTDRHYENNGHLAVNQHNDEQCIQGLDGPSDTSRDLLISPARTPFLVLFSLILL